MNREDLLAHSFDAGDSGYPGLSRVFARLAFPNPLTFGDYKKWHKAMLPLDGRDADDPENHTLVRQYCGAMAVVNVEEVEPPEDLEPDPDDPPFPVSELTVDNEEVPIDFVSWVTDCADIVIGRQIIVEPLPTVIARRQQNKYTAVSFPTNYPDALLRLPDMRHYKGTVSFAKTITRARYVKYDKARRLKDKLPVNHPENTFLARQLRAATHLIDTWDISDADGVAVPFGRVTAQDGDKLPLVLASWLCEVADTFLSHRLNQKKMLRL